MGEESMLTPVMCGRQRQLLLASDGELRQVGGAPSGS